MIENQNISEFKTKADIKNYSELINWFNNKADEIKLADKFKTKLQLAIEEIFVNIASYAYNDNNGEAIITFEKNNNSIRMQFIDKGHQYNPLVDAPAPDVNASVEDRPIGGLGIFMVKNLMDEVEYKYENSQNILTIILNL